MDLLSDLQHVWLFFLWWWSFIYKGKSTQAVKTIHPHLLRIHSFLGFRVLDLPLWGTFSQLFGWSACDWSSPVDDKSTLSRINYNLQLWSHTLPGGRAPLSGGQNLVHSFCKQNRAAEQHMERIMFLTTSKIGFTLIEFHSIPIMFRRAWHREHRDNEYGWLWFLPWWLCSPTYLLSTT
jgi:hypothetical protein